MSVNFVLDDCKIQEVTENSYYGYHSMLADIDFLPQEDGRASRLKVHITDLTYLWTESLERKEIVRKATFTSIDPSYQLNVLLEYLIKGLDLTPGTSLSLRSEKGRSHLVMHLKCPLPAPLKPLEWDFDMRQASEQEFTKEFVLSLIGNLYEQQEALCDLATIIAEKDKAIQRVDTELKTHNKEIIGLFDKRFFGENAPEKHKKSILMNKLPGFKPFDKDFWQTARNDQILPSQRDLNKHVFESGIPAERSNLGSSFQGAWWEDLGDAVEIEEPSQISQPTIRHRSSTLGFEPRNVNARDSRNEQNSTQDSYQLETRRDSINNNDEADDSDATASTNSDLESSTPNPPSRGIGRIGGTKAVTDQAESGPRVSPPPPKSAIKSGVRSTDVEANEGRPRGGIGKIGGLRARQGAESEPSPTLSQSGNLPTRPTSNAVDGNAHLTSQVINGTQPEAVETAEQRADRQREMLKHDLEEKRKAPLKKKRKF